MSAENDEVVIRYGLRDEERRRAAEIYYEAFGGKLGVVLGPPETAIPILADGFTDGPILVAFYRGEAAGLACLKFNGEDFLSIRASTLAHKFGWIESLSRLIMLRLIDQSPPKGGLLLDSIAIDGRFRSLGIGRRLIEAVFDLARNRRLTEVVLQVVDTNPRAQSLYERLGFTAVRTRRVPFMRSIMGFSAYTTMTKPVR